MHPSVKTFRSSYAGFLMAGVLSACTGQSGSDSALFERSVLQSSPEGSEPWAKFVGDLNSDGVPELFVGYHDTAKLQAFSVSAGLAEPVVPTSPILTDGGVADLNDDGINDLIVLTEAGAVAYESPDFRPVQLLEGRLHDVLFVDEDSDGAPEVVVRNQTAFGSGSGDVRILKRRPETASWEARTLYSADGEGLAVADVDGDGDDDIVVAAVWLENTGESRWLTHRYTSAWSWPHAKIAVADFDRDGFQDIVLAPAEPVEERYKIAWYRQPSVTNENWQERILVEDIESVVHALQAGDVDGDGDTDVVYAQMHQGEDPDAVVLLENPGNGESWQRQRIDNRGSHNLQMFDWDGDGDLDIAGANWRGPDTDVVLWENSVCDAPWSHWSRHVIDDDRPSRAVFVLAGDLDGDGLPDVVSGNRAYLNPGSANESWRVVALGTSSADATAIWDVDQDGDLDVLVAVDDAEQDYFTLYSNSGDGQFDARETGVRLSGDFLQGTAQLELGDRRVLALSWHEAGHGIELLYPPGSGNDAWVLQKATNHSQDEALSAGDIDGDGDTDLLLGTSWLRNDASGWSVQTVEDTAAAPDRNLLVDLDGDGDLDAVVGFEAISEAGDIVWYESRDGDWVRHLIGRAIGPMSLDVADVDRDGDLDVIAGEHNLQAPESARLWVFENVDGTGSSWEPRQIYVGDEHHDGTQAVDVDFDGDMDIVSIGWGHNNVLWYENRMPLCK